MRFSSAMSVFGATRSGSSVSLLDFVHLGSSLSLREFGRICTGGLSALDFVRFGSTLTEKTRKRQNTRRKAKRES